MYNCIPRVYKVNACIWEANGANKATWPVVELSIAWMEKHCLEAEEVIVWLNKWGENGT